MNRIHSVSITGLHGIWDYEAFFNDRLSLLHGVNGTGKTTLLHILANAADGDFARFYSLDFLEIIIRDKDYRELIIRYDTRNVTRTSSRLKGKRISVFINGNEYPIDPSGLSKQALISEVNEFFGGKVVYFPAFRLVLDSLHKEFSGRHDEATEKELKQIVTKEERRQFKSTSRPRVWFRHEDPNLNIARKTVFCRKLFGEFVPTIKYPSLDQVSEEIISQLAIIEFTLSDFDRQSIPNLLVNVFESSAEDHSKTDIEESNLADLAKEVQNLLSNVKFYSQSRDIFNEKLISLLVESKRHDKQSALARTLLEAYIDILNRRLAEQEKLSSRVARYQRVINSFLEGKSLDIYTAKPISLSNPEMAKLIKIKGHSTSFNALSSGERHILGMFHALNELYPEDAFILIDEPEISLHPLWQRRLIEEMLHFCEGKQVIICTHAPETVADHLECLVEIVPKIRDVPYKNRTTVDYSIMPTIFPGEE